MAGQAPTSILGTFQADALGVGVRNADAQGVGLENQNSACDSSVITNRPELVNESPFCTARNE